jgi:CubicO group peptidase (beta-lactamase class C family)
MHGEIDKVPMEEFMFLKRTAIVFLLSIFFSALAAAQTSEGTKLPDTPAGRTLAAFLTAFNSGDLQTLARFHSERGGDEGNAQEDLNFFNQSGGLKLGNVIKSSEYEIEVLTQAKKDGRWLRFKMQVERTAPYQPVEIGVQPAGGPDDVQPRKEPASERSEAPPVAKNMTDAQIAASLGAYLDELSAGDKFSGVVLVAKDGKPIFEKAYGLANKAKNIPNNRETKFNLGSMNKMFTSVAIAQLVQAGKLSFDDTVGKHLPDYPNKDVANKVTIHHLLTHTSGLGSYWNAKFEARKGSIKTVSDYISLFADEPVAVEPGKRFQYSNSGFIVLGAIIEKAAGQSYYDYVREHIYKPAGMTHTDAYEMTADTPNLAMGYATDGEKGSRRENSGTRPNRGGPAGGGYSTVEDLLRFHAALRNHKLLNQKYTELITAGKVEMGGAKYAYGFGDEVINGKRVFGHNGGAPGIASDLSMYPELGYTSVVMTNYDPPLMMPVVRRIRQMITQTR